MRKREREGEQIVRMRDAIEKEREKATGRAIIRGKTKKQEERGNQFPSPHLTHSVRESLSARERVGMRLAVNS